MHAPTLIDARELFTKMRKSLGEKRKQVADDQIAEVTRLYADHTEGERVNIPNAQHRLDTGPIDPACPCSTCRTHSRAYLRHLYLSKEILDSRLATLHNLTFYARHVRRLRERILAEGQRA